MVTALIRWTNALSNKFAYFTHNVRRLTALRLNGRWCHNCINWESNRWSNNRCKCMLHGYRWLCLLYLWCFRSRQVHRRRKMRCWQYTIIFLENICWFLVWFVSETITLCTWICRGIGAWVIWSNKANSLQKIPCEMRNFDFSLLVIDKVLTL